MNRVFTCLALILFFVSSAHAAESGAVLDKKWLPFVHIQKLNLQPLPTSFKTTGRIAYNEQTTQHLATPLNGRVTRVLADLGHLVRPGETLIELASPDAAALQAELLRSRQDLDIAERAWKRAQRLSADGAISEKDLAVAQAEFHKAKADVQRDQAQLASLGLEGQGTGVLLKLTARLAGTVVERHVRVGQQVQADQQEPLLTLSNLDSVWVLADLYEQDLNRVKPGTEIEVSVSAYPKQVFSGKIIYVGDVVDTQTRTVKVRCLVPNPKKQLKPEMFATLAIKNSENTGLLVPRTALVREHEQQLLLVVQNGQDSTDMRIVERPVKIGLSEHEFVQIIAGVSEGESVVTDGALFLHHALRNKG